MKHSNNQFGILQKFVSLSIPLFFLSHYATAATDSANVLSLSDALKHAKEQSLQVLQGKLQEVRAKAAYDSAFAQRLPQLSAVGAISKSDDPATQLPDANKAVGRIEQSLSPFSPDWLRGDLRAKEWEIAGLTRVESEQDVSLLVKTTYFSILRDDEAVQSLNLVEEQIKKLQQAIIPRYSVGGIPPFDLVKVKTALSDIFQQRNLRTAQLKSEMALLALTLGLPLTDGFTLKALTAVPPVPNREEKSLQVFSANPSLAALQLQTQASELGVKVSKSARFPSLLAAFEYGYSGQTAESMSRGWDISLGVKIPLWTWGEISSQISQQEADLEVSKVKLRLETQNVSVGFVQANQNAEAYLAAQNRLKELLPETKTAALTSIARYRQGAVGILEASDAFNLWLQTLLNERSSYYSYLSELAKIERLLGKSVVVYEN